MPPTVCLATSVTITIVYSLTKASVAGIHCTKPAYFALSEILLATNIQPAKKLWFYEKIFLRKILYGTFLYITNHYSTKFSFHLFQVTTGET